MYVRGGLPKHVNGTTAVDTLEQWPKPAVLGGVGNSIRFENTGVNPLVLSLNDDDAQATPQKGVTVAAAEVLELPAEISSLWTRSTLGSTFEAIVFVRRG